MLKQAPTITSFASPREQRDMHIL